MRQESVSQDALMWQQLFVYWAERTRSLRNRRGTRASSRESGPVLKLGRLVLRSAGSLLASLALGAGR
jgi:hypothetical protein